MKKGFYRKAYFQMKNQQDINIRLNAEEHSLLETWMREDGWERTSTFIKYRLGLPVDKDSIVREIVATGSVENVAILLKNSVLEFTAKFVYYSECFLESVKSTSKNAAGTGSEKSPSPDLWIGKLKSFFGDTMRKIDRIMNETGMKSRVKNYADLPSVDFEHPNKQDLNLLMARLDLYRASTGKTCYGRFDFITKPMQQITISGTVVQAPELRESGFLHIVVACVNAPDGEFKYSFYSCLCRNINEVAGLKEGDTVFLTGSLVIRLIRYEDGEVSPELFVSVSVINKA